MFRTVPFLLWVGLWLLLSCRLLSDTHVAVTALASPAYTQRKFENGKVRMESYVVMQGHFFQGTTIDNSIEKMSFRQIAAYLARELVKQNYVPAKDRAGADLLLIVHWGTTIPHVSMMEMMAQTTQLTDMSSTAAGVDRALAASPDVPEGVPPPSLGGNLSGSAYDDVTQQHEFDTLTQLTDQLGSEMTRGSNMTLLGYGRYLRRLGENINPTEEERTLREDLAGERYFVIVKAYDLHETVAFGQTRRAVWTLHLNIRSPGTNFALALERMSVAAAQFAGRTTENVETVTPKVRTGTVDIGTPVILGEVK